MNQEPARRSLIRAAMHAPYLARDEEAELARRWSELRDQDALHRITTAHMRLVIAMASRFRSYGLPMNDLIQEGHVGLLEAAARFDPGREVRFSTYATWWIRASMQDFVLRNWSIVRGGTSSAQKALFFKLRRLRARLGRQAGNERPPYDEIAAALGVTVADVALMDARMSGPDTSLSQPISEQDGTSGARQDLLVDDEPLPDAIAANAIDGERRSGWLHAALDVLDKRERAIISERRLSEEGATLESLAARLGISKERVRQLESRALDKLRGALVQANPEMAALAN